MGGAARSRRARRPRRRSTRRAARGGARAGDRVGRAGVRVRRARRGDGAPRQRADRVAPPDRAPDDRRQRGGRAAALRAQACRRCTASTSAPSRRRSSGCSTQLASLGVPTPPAPERMSPSQAAEVAAQCSLMVDEHVRRTGHGRTGLTFARPALAAAGALRPGEPRPRRARARRTTATSPRRSAAIPISSATARCWPRSAGARSAPRPHGLDEAGRVVRARGARRDVDRARRRRRRALLPARARAARARLGRAVRRRGHRPDRRGRVHHLRRGRRRRRARTRASCRCAASPAAGGSSTRQGTILLSDGGGALRLGDPLRVGVERVEAPRGRVDLRVEAGSEIGSA